MKCVACSSLGAKLCCEHCGFVYCNEICQSTHWVSHQAKFAPIEGKRGREDEPCLNETDPFTLDDLNTIEPGYVIRLGAFCFHLPSIFDWIVNRGNTSNPLTNLPFSAQEQANVLSVGYERFPMRVGIRPFVGRSLFFESCSLNSVTALIIAITNKILAEIVKTDRSVTTIREVLLILVEYRFALYIPISEDVESTSLISFLRAKELEQMVGRKEWIVGYSGNVPNDVMLNLFREYRAFFQYKGWPTDPIVLAIRNLALSMRERGDMIHVKIRIIGHDLGLELWMMPGDFLKRIKDVLAPRYDLAEDKEWIFTHRGVQYSERNRLLEIGFQRGDTITVEIKE